MITMPAKLRVRASGPVLSPASQVVLTQQHSFELMKTVITATISHVLWARRVFPKITYHLRSYDPADPDVSYDGLMKGIKGIPESFDASENLMIWKILPRGQDHAVDKILDCIEIGATDALKRGFLAKLQVSLHSVDESTIAYSNLIESYTMIFEYEDGQVMKIGSEIDMKSAVIRSAKQDVYGLVNDVGFLIHHNNRYRSRNAELPAQFRMFLSLKYNDAAPASYQPPMFRPGDSNTSNLLESGLANPNLQMSTAFHRVSVGIHISENEDYTSASQPLTTDVSTNAQHKANSILARPLTLLSPPTDGKIPQLDASKQTQDIVKFRSSILDTQDTVILDSIKKNQKIPAISATNEELVKNSSPMHTQSVHDHMISVQAKSQEGNFNNMHKPFQCECMVPTDNESSFCCCICGNLKHARCYGYLDEALPVDLLCYLCLLGKSDKERVEKIIKPLTLKRRALYYLREKGILRSISEMALHLNNTKYKVTRLLSDLKAEGFVKSRRRDKKFTHTAIYTGDDEKLRRFYFRPQQGIDHLLNTPNPTASFMQDSSRKNNSISSVEAQRAYDLSRVGDDNSRSLPSRNQTGTPVQINSDQQDTQAVNDIDIFEQATGKIGQTIDLAQDASQILSNLDVSTQGTPSPRSVSHDSFTQEPEHLDPVGCDEYIIRKRSYTNMGNDSAAESENCRRLKTSRASPWLIENY